MRIAICDDDEYYRNHFAELARDYAAQNKASDITIGAFSHAEQLLDSINKSGGYDIYLLDIIMPGMNGIELGEELRRKGFDEKIIYLSTSEEFALASYRVNAANYIIKPVDDGEFITELDKVVKSVSGLKEKFTLVRTKGGSVKLRFDSIVYAELIRRTVVYHMKDGKTVESVYIRTNFDDAIKALTEDERFIRCGKSLLVNMHHIVEIGSETIGFDNDSKISAGRKLCREVHNAWVRFSFSEEENI